MPRILYKYLDVTGARWVLGMEERKYPNLKFTNPSKMNDPFDCHPNLLDYSDIPDSMTHGWIPKQWIQDKESIDALNKRNNASICCFSKVNDALLMWTHYCNNHKGICIGFNIDNVINGVPQLFDSFFCEPLVLEINYVDIEQRPDFKSVPWTYQLETKDKQWEYEQEIRLVFPTASHFNSDFPESAKSNDVTELCDYLPLKGDGFESIYFGKDIDLKVKDELIDFIRTELNPNCQLYQMAIDNNAFRLKAERI